MSSQHPHGISPADEINAANVPADLHYSLFVGANGTITATEGEKKNSCIEIRIRFLVFVPSASSSDRACNH